MSDYVEDRLIIERGMGQICHKRHKRDQGTICLCTAETDAYTMVKRAKSR